MVTEYFISILFLVSIIGKKERLVLNYLINFLDGRAYAAGFPGTLEPLLNFIMNSMTQLGFKNEWCPFSRNLFARSSAKRVSTKLGSASTQQTSCSGIIATGLTTLVMTRNFGSAMAIITYFRVRVPSFAQRLCALEPACDISVIVTELHPTYDTSWLTATTISR